MCTDTREQRVNQIIANINLRLGYAPENGERFEKLFGLADLSIALGCKLSFRMKSGVVKYNTNYSNFGCWQGEWPQSYLAYCLNRRGVEKIVDQDVADEFHALVDLINASDKDQRALLAEIGIMSGSCCFCGKELTTDASKSAGYGPVCAGKYGLPWGAKGELAGVARKRRVKVN